MVDLDQHLELIPESLKLLLKPLLKDDKRVALWGQNIIRISRPRSGVLPLPMRYALQFDHRFVSKWLIDELHYHGFCESYKEVANYKYCYLRSTFKSRLESSNSCQTIVENIEDENAVDEELQLSPDDHYLETETSNSQPRFSSLEYSGVQYVGDNSDLNIVSINGNTPFHAMGMIKIVNQSVALTDNYMNMKLPRLKLTAKEKAKILKAGDIPIQHCKDPKKSGINSITFIPLIYTSNSAEDMWLAGWILKKKDGTFLHSNWNGWMKSIHNSVSKEISHIEYQPSIDGNPNDYSTIYTSLRCIESEKPKVSVITFDLPIWLKSVDILSHKLPVIPRLGGFHLIKSFLGTFGHIFSDSGLHEIIELIYPGQVVAESILNGNSYDKAIRAHLSIDAAIVQHVLPPNEFTDAELSAIECLINHALENQNGIDSNEFPIVDIIQSKIKSVFDKLGLAGRTPALWVLYHNMVQTIKIFIRAERMADFSLHLSCITNRMLHHKYAKCARLYVQMMLSYKDESPEKSAVIQSFKSTGSHVIRY